MNNDEVGGCLEFLMIISLNVVAHLVGIAKVAKHCNTHEYLNQYVHAKRVCDYLHKCTLPLFRWPHMRRVLTYFRNFTNFLVVVIHLLN